jgi:hypothetical protein
LTHIREILQWCGISQDRPVKRPLGLTISVSVGIVKIVDRRDPSPYTFLAAEDVLRGKML